MAVDTLILMPLRDMALRVVNVIPTLLSVFVILVIGLLLAKLLHDVLTRVFKEIHLDKLSDRFGLSGLLTKGGVKSKFSALLASTVYLVTIIMFVIMALEMVGMTTAHSLIAMLVAYIPQVISAVFVIVMGMILATVLSRVVYAVAGNLNIPHPHTHRKITHYAVLVYTIKIGLEELGFGFLFVGTVFHIWFAGVVLAMAIAYGLGGQTAASKHLAGRKS